MCAVICVITRQNVFYPFPGDFQIMTSSHFILLDICVLELGSRWPRPLTSANQIRLNSFLSYGGDGRWTKISVTLFQSPVCPKCFTTLVTFTHWWPRLPFKVPTYSSRATCCYLADTVISCSRILRHATGGAGDSDQQPLRMLNDLLYLLSCSCPDVLPHL